MTGSCGLSAREAASSLGPISGPLSLRVSQKMEAQWLPYWTVYVLYPNYKEQFRGATKTMGKKLEGRILVMPGGSFEDNCSNRKFYSEIPSFSTSCGQKFGEG